MGAGMVARALSTFVFFPVATKLLSIRRVMIWTAFASLLIMTLYIFVDTFIPLLIITIVFSLVYPNLLPAMESSASVLIQTERIHYGKSRSFGSIGYTVGLLLIGAVTAIWNEQAILWVMLIGLALVWYFHTRPAPPSLAIKPQIREGKNKKSEVKRLITSKPFVTVLLLSILLQGAHASYYNYGFIYLQDLGVNSLYIGLVLIVAVLLEILFFARADLYFSNTKVSTMYLIAASGSTLRWVLIFLFPTVWVFVFSQLLHAVSFGVAHYAFIQFISKRLSQNEIPTAQGMYASLAMGLSTAILTFAGGYLYEISPGIAFLGMTSCTIPSIFLVLLTRKKFSY
jgi:PPP family 3-phenylpropionic acid transporter